MSIRLRLTLIYSLILGLTLICFSSVLYFSQVRLTMDVLQTRLASRIVSELEQNRNNQGRNDDGRNPPRRFRPPGPVVYTQVRDLDGEIIERDVNLGEDILPLSRDGLLQLQDGDTWVELYEVEGERYLVHSRPVRINDGEIRIVQVAGSLFDRDQYLTTLRNVLIVGSAVALFVAFGAGWFLAGFTLRPINRIRQTAQTIGTERDFTKRVDYVGPNDEIGQLATTFNSMLTELQASYLQVEQSLQTQKRFVADASHELRTPLTTIRGNIELLQRHPTITPEDKTDVLDDMAEESERLMRLVNDLLALARVDSKRKLNQTGVDFKTIVEDTCQQIKKIAPERDLVCQTPAELSVLGDQDALKQIVLILLDNALKHTPSETKIRVRANQTKDHIVLSVQDTGPGIAPALIPHIFDRFYQGDTARSGTSTGLGLAIAKELTEAQQGSLTVESVLGDGATFVLTLPRLK